MGKQHLLGFGTVSVVFILKPDMGVIDFEDAVSGDGDLVGISSEIFHYPFGRTEGSLGIDVPFFVPDSFEDSIFVCVPLDGTVFFEHIHEYGLEHFGHACLWEEEAVVFASGLYPLVTVKASGTDDAVHPDIRDRLWGWKLKSCPHVCKTIVIPGSAPRYSGILACLIRVCEAAANRALEF
jgi:hypothetical protein